MKYIWKIEKNSYGLETWIHLKDIDYIFVLSKQSDGALYHNYKVEDYMAEVTLLNWLVSQIPWYHSIRLFNGKLYSYTSMLIIQKLS